MRGRRALVLLAAAPAPSSAQTVPPDRGVRSDGHGAVGEPLAADANSFTEARSFTEAQVTERFGRMGFGAVRDLRKDESGIWRGIATHAGHEVHIGMDDKGNVAAR